MKMRRAKTMRFETSETGKEFSDELAGVLTAISIVSRRLARRLDELDEITASKGASAENEEQESTVCKDADKSQAV